MSQEEQADYVRHIGDIREAIGFPMSLKHGKSATTVIHPEDLLKKLTAQFSRSKDDVILEAFDGESEVMIETFLRGKEFSCIVIQDENGKPYCPPSYRNTQRTGTVRLPLEVFTGIIAQDYTNRPARRAHKTNCRCLLRIVQQHAL